MIKTKIACIAAGCLLIATGNSNASSILINGGFEAPQLVPVDGETSIGQAGTGTGWTGTGNSFLLHGFFYGLSPYEGNQYMNFNGGDLPANAVIEQSFSTTIGKSYTVSYVVGLMGGSGSTVGLRGQILSSSNAILGSQDDYTALGGWLAPTSFDFTATSSTTTIRFTDISPNTYSQDVCFDAVSVTANNVPDSASYGCISGLVALAGFGRMVRRR